MNHQSTKRILFSVIAVIFLLTACAPAAPAATQDPALVQQLIEQSVALTVAAQSAQTQEAQALVADPTNTPLPTQTESAPPAPSLPTATPFVIVPPTLAPVTGGGGGGTTVKPDFACDVIRQRPYDNTIFKPNDAFDLKWTIVNTGTRTWKAGLDLKYFSGPEMTPANAGPIQLPEMKPGDQFAVNLDAHAPDTEGFHVMTWTIEGQICYPYIAIYVEK
jgi:hypothetical protein